MSRERAVSLAQETIAADPTMRQRLATDPLSSIWVGASAGTGKTKVLTDRVLRLLLPRADGSPGTPVGRILCLTFTKAGASEMALRIGKILREWTILPIDNENSDRSLRAALAGVLGQTPSPEQIAAAQKLFAELIEAPGGLQIMTIHAFCQSILGRFPLEAGLPPNFVALDEVEAKKLLQQAKQDVLTRAQKPEMKTSPLSLACAHIAQNLDERSFEQELSLHIAERHQLTAMLQAGGVELAYAKICQFYNIGQNEDFDAPLRQACALGAPDEPALRAVAQDMLRSRAKSAKEQGQQVITWLNAEPPQRLEMYKSFYRSIFLKVEGEACTHNFPVKDVLLANPGSLDIVRAESARLMVAEELQKKIASAAMTRDLLILCGEIYQAYTALKAMRAGLDFDDMIIRTMDLLRGTSAGLSGLAQSSTWVMYKLDQGLDHILVDEAQDTNPEQWKIIEALCDEFFSGEGARDDTLRTMFVVGDIKQSIYGFQRAAPEEFIRMEGVFDMKIKGAGQRRIPVQLETSFRSTQSVLRLVDQVFASDTARQALGRMEVRHISHRAGQAGLVELWPLIALEKQKERDFWTTPNQKMAAQSPSVLLAEQIATEIRGWLDRGEMLLSQDRPVTPGDILVLVQTRTAFVDHLVRALKGQKIPVSGADRMTLSEQLVVQDMLALARFALLPEDDLSLACVLKSPLLNMDEDALFALAHRRAASLWAEMSQYTPDKFSSLSVQDYPILDMGRLAALRAYLERVRTVAQHAAPYEFFMDIVYKPCPGHDVSGLAAITQRLGTDALDPLEEFLNEALRAATNIEGGLQHFISVQEKSETQIKRELEDSGGKVRIMTVHGSKGLEAPIVFLPDTLNRTNGRKASRFLWPDKTGLPMPLWSARQQDAPKAYAPILERVQKKQEEEKLRLLYVAMTRASDRLYIAGFENGKSKTEGSWYALIRAALAGLPDCVELANGRLRLENPQTQPPKLRIGSALEQSKQQSADIPGWARQQASEEIANTPAPAPSQGINAAGAVFSPRETTRQYRYRCGVLTHKLLQILPDLPSASYAQAGAAFLKVYGSDLPEDIRHRCLSEVLAILNNPDFAPFFGAGAMAEVPILGQENGQPINGQIDRLVVGSNDVWIVDYKTNRPPPTDPTKIPPAYLRQMALYRHAIAAIYPERSVHCALLWTYGPRLMIINP